MRIVTHTCSNTEIVCALGAAQAIVGVDNHSDYPPAVVQKVAKIGPDLDIDIEKIKALRPDWVITSLTVPGHERCVQKIKQAGLRHLVTSPTSLADVMNDFQRIGEILEKKDQAARWVEAFQNRLQRKTKTENPVPIAIEWWPKPVIVPGQRSWVNEMLCAVGATNPFSSHDKESLEITGTMAEQSKVEAVVMSWCGVAEDKYRPHIVSRRPDWAQVPAIVNRHIYPISEAWLGRPGPRLIEGMDRLAEVVARVRGDKTSTKLG